MFSIVIPVYNKSAYVEKAVRSVLEQTYRDFEIIIVNDGSTDNSLEAVRNIDVRGVDVSIINQQNSGVSTARNNGVKIAKYDYITFLDADDWWAPTFLEEMKALVEKFPDAGIYGSGYYIVKNGKNTPAKIGINKDFESGYINYCQVYAKTLVMPLWIGAVCLPRSVFDEMNGFKPNLKLGEDFDLWIRIAMKHPVAFLNRSLSYYNQDVDVQNRAVGTKFYKPEEHMIFTDYGESMNDADFRFLYEKLALYGLLPYYINNINAQEIKSILSTIHWPHHERKYYFYYKRMPRWATKTLFYILKKGSETKSNIIKKMK